MPTVWSSAQPPFWDSHWFSQCPRQKRSAWPSQKSVIQHIQNLGHWPSLSTLFLHWASLVTLGCTGRVRQQPSCLLAHIFSMQLLTNPSWLLLCAVAHSFPLSCVWQHHIQPFSLEPSAQKPGALKIQFMASCFNFTQKHVHRCPLKVTANVLGSMQ